MEERRDRSGGVGKCRGYREWGTEDPRPVNGKKFLRFIKVTGTEMKVSRETEIAEVGVWGWRLVVINV